MARLHAKMASLNFATLNPKNGFTVLISRVENQIDYHTYNSSILKYLPKTENLSATVGAAKVCGSVKPFPARKPQKLSDAAKISDARRDAFQKFTTKIIRENQAIFVEGLNVAGMLKNHNLAKHIGDAAFAEIFRELEYKAGWYGRTYLALDRFFPSSKLCSRCGHLLDELPLSVREWDCPACGGRHDRDINAAINIKLVGQYLLKTTGSDARKVTPTRNERRRSA